MINELTSSESESAIRVHNVLRPGLFESLQKECLAYKLTKKGLRVEKQKAAPFIYEEVKLKCGHRIDL